MPVENATEHNGVSSASALIKSLERTETPKTVSFARKKSWPLRVMKDLIAAQTNSLRDKAQLDDPTLETLSWFV